MRNDAQVHRPGFSRAERKTFDTRAVDARRPAVNGGLSIAAIAGVFVVTFLAVAPLPPGRAEPPSVDDLLNIKPTPKPAENAPPANGNDAPKPAQTPEAPRSIVPIDPSVQRKLAGQDAGDLFQQALRDMSEASERMGKKSDVFTDTQRLQAEAIQKLDRVIASSSQQQQSSSSSSSSSSQDQQSGSQQSQGSDKNQQQGDRKQGDKQGDQQGDNASKQGENSGGSNPSDRAGKPPRPPGNPNDPLEQTRKEWGGLPSRTRDELIQAQNEPFSPVYRELTEQYYRRLAEEKK